ncbi:hypothetical protein BGZ99_005775 [Dissophora globulifera]|uniref:histidine kinase n=1 Tax=Dissophora globulifera TaxID=979702 RepID=A0A9P6UZY1_9FUNG|nr:hypothetical protein BGZ99_005775 [Dissophora globulifera]
MSDLLCRQGRSASNATSISTPAYSNIDPMQSATIPSRQIGLTSFLLWLKEHPSSSKIGSENLARFLLVKSVSLIAASLGCVYGLVFDKQLSIPAFSALLFFLPAVQGATGATRMCGMVLSLALASVFLSFHTRSIPLLGPSLETTLLFGLPVITSLLVGRKVGFGTCVVVLAYSIEEYQTCVRDANRYKDIAVANAKSKDGVVSSVSHELRTPLAALIGWTELLMSDQTLSSSAQSTVSMLHSSTLSLLTILNALLDVSKVSAAKMASCSQNFNLHDLVLDTARMMTGLSGTRTVELLVDFSAQVPELVRADPGIIKQVLGNLISNAIKFTDVGYVNVGVSLKEEDDDSVTVEFVVQDTGKGIADEQKDKLFVEFSQVEGGRCMSHEAGTGLGLFLVKNLVELMSGTVFVSSKLGVGSTFGFVIKMEKQYLAFRTPGYDHVVTVSSAFQAGDIQELDPTSPKLPVTPGLARSTTPQPVAEPMVGVRLTPVSTPDSSSKEQNQAKDYFTSQPMEVTRANANNITLRTRDNAFLSNRQYYLHSQCGYFEDFLWNTASSRWKAYSARRLTFDECINGWQSDASVDSSLSRFGDVFLIDLSPTTNRPKSEALLTDQEHARLYLTKFTCHLIKRAKARISAARQASVVLFYPFGHPPSLAQEPLLTLGQYYQISLCRKPVSERALGAIIKRQIVTVQTGITECDSTGPCPTSNSSSLCMAMSTALQGVRQACQDTKKVISSDTTDNKGSEDVKSAGKTSSDSSDKHDSAFMSGNSSMDSLSSEDSHSLSESETAVQRSSISTQASHVRFSRRNGTVPKIALNTNTTLSPAAESATALLLERPPKSLLKSVSVMTKPKTRPTLTSKDSIRDLNESGRRVLIVDDNSFNRNLLYHQLTKLGVSRVDQAGSGQEAVDMFMPGLHVLVLMDLKMPTMGGFQATTLIREKEIAHWGPSAVMSELPTGSPIIKSLSDCWLDNLCPWSPERFVGASDSVLRSSSNSSNTTESSSSMPKPVKKDGESSASGSTKATVQLASIVAVTADWTAEIGEDRKKALSGGFDDVMVKPISLPSLSVLLERYM